MKIIVLDKTFSHIFCKKRKNIVKALMDELDSFRERTMAAALANAPVGVQDLVKELFHY